MNDSTHSLKIPQGLLRWQTYNTTNATLWADYVAHGRHFCLMEPCFTEQFDHACSLNGFPIKIVVGLVIGYFLIGFTLFCILAAGKLEPWCPGAANKSLDRLMLLASLLLYLLASVLWPITLLSAACYVIYLVSTRERGGQHGRHEMMV
jgi:hypothetical protein